MVDITLVQAQIGSYFAIISTNTVTKNNVNSKLCQRFIGVTVI